MNASPAPNSESAPIIVVRGGVHWLAFLSVFGLMFMAGVAAIVSNDVLTGLPLLTTPSWGWVFIVVFAAILGKVFTLKFHDKMSLSSEGLIIYGGGYTKKSYNWSDFGGIGASLFFGDVTLTFASRGCHGKPISRGMAKSVLEHPSCPKDWYLPPLILEYIHTGRIPKGVTWIGRGPTAEENLADQSKPYFYRQKMRNRSTAWVGLAFSIIALLLSIVILLIAH